MAYWSWYKIFLRRLSFKGFIWGLWKITFKFKWVKQISGGDVDKLSGIPYGNKEYACEGYEEL